MNPFLTSAEIRLLKKKTITNISKQVEEGTNQIVTTTTNTNLVEIDKFVKVYRIPYQLNLIKELTSIGCKLFFYIQVKLKLNDDWIDLHRAKVAKDLGISETSVSNAIGNLIDNGILCKKGTTDYWINPIILFAGDRKQYFLQNAPKHIIYVEDKNPTMFNFEEKSSDNIIMV